MKKKLAAVLLLLLLSLGLLAGYRHHMMNIVIGGWTPQLGPEDALLECSRRHNDLYQWQLFLNDSFTGVIYER